MYKGRTSRPQNNSIIKILDTTLQSHCSAIREAQEPAGRLLGALWVEWVMRGGVFGELLGSRNYYFIAKIFYTGRQLTDSGEF